MRAEDLLSLINALSTYCKSGKNQSLAFLEEMKNDTGPLSLVERENYMKGRAETFHELRERLVSFVKLFQNEKRIRNCAHSHLPGIDLCEECLSLALKSERSYEHEFQIRHNPSQCPTCAEVALQTKLPCAAFHTDGLDVCEKCVDLVSSAMEATEGKIA